MKLTDFFIKRPVFAAVVNLIIFAAGYEAVQSLHVREYPRSDIAVISITTAYLGASANLVGSYITAPIERVVSSAEGIDYIDSTSTEGLSTVKLHLQLNQNPNAILSQIQTKLAEIRNQMPPEAENSLIEIVNSDEKQAAMYLGFTCEQWSQSQITDFLTRVIQPKLATVNGIQRADILGARVIAMRIWLKPDRLAALEVSASEIAQALRANNYNATLGKTKGTMTSLNLLANTSLSTPDEFKQLVIKEKNGVLVHLEDVADVELGAEDYNSNISFNGKNGIFMGLWCLPTANTLEVVKHIRAELPQLRALLPSGMKLDVSYDSSIYIEHAITEVTHTLIETLIIVVIVIFLFLGSFRSVLIPMVTIPISLVGTALILLIAGFTINLLTLLAIVLAVGLVVDDAIIVVENIERYLQKGLSPYHASMKGARELVAPIIGMTMTLVAVYTPLGVQSGLTGALFREFSLTLAGAVVISGIVALTLSPMMSSLLLRADENKTGFSGVISRCFSGLQEQYKKMLTSLLHYRGAILIMALLWIALLPVLYFFSKKELAPQEDKGIVSCIIEAAPNATVDQILIYTQLLNGIFKDLPETEKFFQLVNSGSGSAGGHSGIITKPWKERQRTTQELVPILNQKVAEIPGVRIFATVPPPLPGGMKLPINFVVSGMVEPEQLLKVTHQLMSAANQSGLFSYVDDDLKYDQPQLEITFDRNKVSSLGLNLQQVASDLSVLFSGAYVNRFSIQGQSYKVIPQIKREDRLNSDQLKKIYVTGPPIIPLDAPPGTKPQPQLIQLSTFASFKQSTQPRELKHFQQMNSVSITGALAPGVSLDEGLKFLEKTASKIVPSGYVIDYAGESRQLHTEGNRLLKTMLFSFLFIFLVLAAQFESFRDPIIVLFGSVPLALSGALLFSFLGWTTINIYSQVGLITLIGLVSKNGILIVQFANRRQLEGMSSWDAIIDAASIRLRPILMISIATIAGHLPLIFAKGPGAAARNSIGIVLVSGMAIGTLFTLFVVPAIYLFISRKKTLASKHYLHGNAFEHTITLA